ncbi:hypothetical protein [Roseibacillus ishigakijimensis]|uniref:Uncharacterized protein n=1 Tax=Roseibacillus ishigakijimensis TaxID=454146 RepID=A0A934VMU7_9BACT|nr:hypothetical protein [Roseibacillus ishigakijimensis]
MAIGQGIVYLFPGEIDFYQGEFLLGQGDFHFSPSNKSLVEGDKGFSPTESGRDLVELSSQGLALGWSMKPLWGIGKGARACRWKKSSGKAWCTGVSWVDDAAAAFVIIEGSCENDYWCGEITVLLGRGPGNNPRALPWAGLVWDAPLGLWVGLGTPELRWDGAGGFGVLLNDVGSGADGASALLFFEVF